MTELERLLVQKLEQMEQQHQAQTTALQKQLDAQQRALASLQEQLGSTLNEYEEHCASLHSTFSALEESTKRELTSMGQSLDQTNRATAAALGSLNSSVSTVRNSLETLSKALEK